MSGIIKSEEFTDVFYKIKRQVGEVRRVIGETCKAQKRRRVLQSAKVTFKGGISKGNCIRHLFRHQGLSGHRVLRVLFFDETMDHQNHFLFSFYASLHHPGRDRFLFT